MSKAKKQVEGMVARTLLLSASLDYRITQIAEERNVPKVVVMRRALEAACAEYEQRSMTQAARRLERGDRHER